LIFRFLKGDANKINAAGNFMVPAFLNMKNLLLIKLP